MAHNNNDANDKQSSIALVDISGAVWITFSAPWWDISSWIWYLLCPGEKRIVMLRKGSGNVRVRAVMIADRHIEISNAEKIEYHE